MRRGSGEAGERGSVRELNGLCWCTLTSPLPRFPAFRMLWLAVAVWLTLPPAVAAQAGRCVFQIDNVDRQGSVSETPQGTNYFAGGNVRLSCRGLPVTMQSDSVAAYGGNVVRFIGNVKYRDSTLTMDADNGTYFRNGEKWEARGRVNTRNLKTGSTLTGPTLDYYRVVKGVRDTLEMYSTGRPRILYAEDPSSRPGEPYVIVADRVRLKGNERLWAGGNVTIDRSDFSARGDSLRLDTGKGSDGTLIGGNPMMRGLGRDSFNLSGRRLDLRLNRRELTYVLAKGTSHAVSKEWDLVADTIGLDIKNRKLERTLAWGDSTRPYATSPSYAMRADSLALDTPGQKLKEVRGFGTAWLGGTIDSISKQRDWMRGDTVVAQFVQRDSAGTSRAALNRIVARKGAQSFHIDPSPKHPDRPSINYSRGDLIVMTMKHGVRTEVDRVDIRGQVDGIQLEATDAAPASDSLAPRPDSLLRGRAGR
jgi:lipopolysaccharide export system protein LptA